MVPSHRPPRHEELDELTLRRARRGDAGAFRVLVETYQDTVFGFLWRMGGARAQRAWAEDLAQETFVRVYRGLAGFDSAGPARLSTWILTIAARLAMKELGRRRWIFARAAPEVAAPQRSDETAERRALQRELGRALAGLGAEQRVVFLLREVHELSLDEIARALEVEVGTVKSRLSRAKAALRAALENVDG